MKLIIDIPQIEYDTLKTLGYFSDKNLIYRAVRNGTSLDDIRGKMMYEIYMDGVNMANEYHGCWVRFKNIERIMDKYIGERSEHDCN